MLTTQLLSEFVLRREKLTESARAILVNKLAELYRLREDLSVNEKERLLLGISADEARMNE